MTHFFLPYQARWIKDPSRNRLMVKSRQIGMSLSTAYDLVLKTAKKRSPFDAWVSSRDELQAQLFGADCARWAGLLHLPYGERSEILLDPNQKISAHVLPNLNPNLLPSTVGLRCRAAQISPSRRPIHSHPSHPSHPSFSGYFRLFPTISDL